MSWFGRWLPDGLRHLPVALVVVSYVYFLFAARRVYGGRWDLVALKGLVPILRPI